MELKTQEMKMELESSIEGVEMNRVHHRERITCVWLSYPPYHLCECYEHQYEYVIKILQWPL